MRTRRHAAAGRRAWFLYEWLTGDRLDLPDAGLVPYVGALDPGLHYVAKGARSRRHKVDNMLGVPGFCPTVRRTTRLEAFGSEAIDQEARRLVAGCDPGVLARAVDYLYTKGTKSTFAIDHEVASGQRAQRFVAALRSSRSFDPTSLDHLLDLQHAIVDPRYAAKGLRDFQNLGVDGKPHRTRPRRRRSRQDQSVCMELTTAGPAAPPCGRPRRRHRASGPRARADVPPLAGPRRTSARVRTAFSSDLVKQAIGEVRVVYDDEHPMLDTGTPT